MSATSTMPAFDAPLVEYGRQAEALVAAVHAQAFPALQRVLAWHPAYVGGPLSAIPCDTFDIEAARQTLACEHGCHTWLDLATLVASIAAGSPAWAFEQAAEAVARGTVGELERLLRADPSLVYARSARRHRGTLLHYVAANGVEPARQAGSPYAVAMAACLADAGADVDARGAVYGDACTTLALVVSTSTLGETQLPLARLLASRGAALETPGTRWPSVILTALAFGHGATASALAALRPHVESLPEAAGLGRLDQVERRLPGASETERHMALALASAHGHTRVVATLLAGGVDPNRPNPAGFHGHSMPLHQAVWAGHHDTVAALVDGGARLDVRDTIYDGTPLEWAEHAGRRELAVWLRARL